MNYFKNT